MKKELKLLHTPIHIFVNIYIYLSSFSIIFFHRINFKFFCKKKKYIDLETTKLSSIFVQKY